MPTVIRCKRGGRTHEPYYRLVVMDSRHRPRGPEIDTLGVYHPCARPEPLSQVDTHKALHWLEKGAQMSDTARGVLSKLGVLKHFHDGTKPEEELAIKTGGVVENKGYNAPPPPKEEPKKEAKAEAPAEEAPVETPAEEPAAEAPVEDAEAPSETEEKSE